MGLTFTKESEDLFVVKVKGTLAFEDLKDFERRARAAIDRSKRVKMLAVFEEFAGWGKEGDWGDLTFMYEYDPFIGRIAVVAENRWKAELLMFLGADRRQARVEFFSEDEADDARDWLRSESE